MTNDTLKLTDQEVLQRAHTVLAEHLPLQADGYTCTTDDLLDVLLGVAANRGTIEAVCADLVGTPDAETIRAVTRDGKDVYPRSLKREEKLARWLGRLTRIVDIDDQVEACRRVFASDTRRMLHTLGARTRRCG